jgi:acyl-CoA reductase-like NAD-dependent aldehyde dehydrogenase
VLVDVDHSMACMTEETFGPTLPIMRVRDVEEAVRLANDTPYGLNATVFSGSTAAGEQIARRLHTGNCGVNDTLTSYFALGTPFGGRKESGVGGRHGAGGIRKFCEAQTLCIHRAPLKRELFHFPNSRLRSKILDLFVQTYYRRGRRHLR